MTKNITSSFNSRASLSLGAGLLAYCAASWSIANPAILVKDASLKSKPEVSATEVMPMQQGAKVEILTRDKGWYQVRSAQGTDGWLRLLEVRFEQEPQSSDNASFSKIVGLRKGHSNVTATTGVRGIGENDIKKAKPDFVSLDKARDYQVTEKDAEKFAKAKKLVTNDIAYEKK